MTKYENTNASSVTCECVGAVCAPDPAAEVNADGRHMAFVAQIQRAAMAWWRKIDLFTFAYVARRFELAGFG
jgi:hypothetical protein